MSGLNGRIHILDALRGLSVIAMIVHHSYVLLNFVRGVTFDFFTSPLFEALQIIFVSIFLLVSGVCTNFSKNVAKRGTVIFGAAVLVTLATALFLPMCGVQGLEIYFGILHMFGCAMLLYALLRPLLDKLPWQPVFYVCIVLFIVYYFWMSKVPFFESPYNFTMIFGFPSRSFYSADYYPLFPYFFLFVAGAMVGRSIKGREFPKWFYDFRFRPFEFVGRHSLLIYLLHQPIVYLLILGMGSIVDLL